MNNNDRIVIKSPMSTQHMETSVKEFYNYWQRIGWTMVSRAETLPGFEYGQDFGSRTKINQARMV